MSKTLIKIAICEDEKAMRDEMSRIVGARFGDDYRVDCFDSGAAMLSIGKKYDIYILDIHMPGISGMETAKRIRSSTDTPVPVIIFTTALKEHMQDAFDVRAFHFLVKPIDNDKFKSVLESAIDECRRSLEQGRIVVRCVVKSNGGTYVQTRCMQSIAYNDIIFVESRNKKVALRLKDRCVEYYGKISEYEGVPEFFRCHRCYAVNMEHIAGYSASEIRLTDNQAVPMSEKKYPEFVKAYLKYSAK